MKRLEPPDSPAMIAAANSLITAVACDDANARAQQPPVPAKPGSESMLQKTLPTILDPSQKARRDAHAANMRKTKYHANVRWTLAISHERLGSTEQQRRRFEDDETFAPRDWAHPRQQNGSKYSLTEAGG